jgi:hypothetical protein
MYAFRNSSARICIYLPQHYKIIAKEEPCLFFGMLVSLLEHHGMTAILKATKYSNFAYQMVSIEMKKKTYSSMKTKNFNNSGYTRNINC